MTSTKQRYRILLVGLIAGGALYANAFSNDEEFSPPRIKNIFIHGSKTFPNVTIKSKLPYHIGERFWPEKSNEAILNLYKLGHFKQVKIEEEKVSKNSVNLHVELTEKPPLKEVIFIGNKHVTQKDIKKKINFEEIPAAQDEELKKFSRIIKSLYAEKGYHFPEIKLSLEKEDDKTIATFTIEEGPKSIIKRVRFKGNKKFTGKKLRSLLFTREDWLLGPLDQSGKYHPLAVEQDKLTLENFYQSHGYLHARAPEADVVFNEDKTEITVTFNIHEGDFYTISNIKAPGNDIYSEKQLLSFLPFAKGSPYSREGIRFAIERLKTIWGDKGYIYADVEPSLQPNDNDKTVALVFYSDLGDKVFLNRINIFGNKKTRDKVVRRQFLVDEGEPLTTTKLDLSKDRISGLGYFDRKDGVNWKINRVDEDLADIDVMLKEIKTGRFQFQLTYGGSPSSMSSSNSGAAAEVTFAQRNLFGKGMVADLTARLGQDEKALSFGFSQPWLFDKPIRVGCSGNYSSNSYGELKKVVNSVQETRAGGAAYLGFVAERLGFTAFNLHAGIDWLDYYSQSLDGTKKVNPEASISGDDTIKSEWQKILDSRFQSGKFAYLQVDAGQDTRNHHTHISRGYKWNATAKLGIPSFGDNFGFYRLETDWHWYTPLIGETDLVLHVHGHLGHVNSFSGNSIPFRELYHVGGQSSVRGWEFGQVGPMWYHPNLLEDEGWQGDSVGAKNAAFFNAELVFPFTEDLSMKGVVFYDGGSGWNTPNPVSIPDEHLKNNSFDYRHSIGIGLRMLNPQPMRIDWGFKLDKRTGESAAEVSFSSYYDF